ncbi:tRNA U34 carboxymethyltransferase [Bienertia sinuspersici]
MVDNTFCLAGILGSILVKEGRMPSVSDVISGAIKVALKPMKQSDSTSTTSKPRNDALMAQFKARAAAPFIKQANDYHDFKWKR